ncbi:MAG: hypothetical protein R6U32_02115 [Candidatus Woesearchaeota archaeon]
MSYIEQKFRQYLSRNPEIEECYQKGLINRRSLARYLISRGIAKPNQLEAVIAMLRRYRFKPLSKDTRDMFKNIKIRIKDRISIMDFEKSKELLEKLQNVIATTDYDKGDTLKIVVGSNSIKVFIDQEKESNLKPVFEHSRLKNHFTGISEISIVFPESVIKTKGTLSTITRQLSMNNIPVTEFLTSSPELLIYVKEEHVMKLYEIIKGLS